MADSDFSPALILNYASSDLLVFVFDPSPSLTLAGRTALFDAYVALLTITSAESLLVSLGASALNLHDKAFFKIYPDGEVTFAWSETEPFRPYGTITLEVV